MKRFVIIAILLIASVSLFSADVTVPEATSFNIFFIKRGTNTFGIYADEECTTPLNTVDFTLLESVTQTATDHTPFYIGWTVYDEINATKYTKGKITIRIADSSDTYTKDLSSETHEGYALSYTDKYNQTIGLNYNVSITGEDISESGSSTTVTSDIITISSDNINKKIQAGAGSGSSTDLRSGSFDIEKKNLGYMKGYRKVNLTIYPPTHNANNGSGFMAVGYTGILAVILEVE